MVDDMKNDLKNQTPISEGQIKSQVLQPEEVAPELTTLGSDEHITPLPDDIARDHATPEPNGNRVRYFIIAGAAISFLVIFGLIFSLFIGKLTTSNKPIKLTYWGLWDDKNIIQPLINEYTKKNPRISIEYIKFSPHDYREKLLSRSKESKGPDIFRFHNTWLPQLKDIATPLPSSIMSVPDFDKTFYPIHRADLKVDKFYYGIPLMIDGLVLIYNDSMYRSAGINISPVSWEDVYDNIIRLTVKSPSGSIVTSGMALGTVSNIEHASDILGLFIVQNGGDYRKLDQPEAEGALENYRRFAEGPDAIWDETMPNSILAFAQEKVAMVILPTWDILTIKSINPTIQLKVAPVPLIPGSKPLSLATYWVEGVSRYSSNQTESWKFLKYLSEKETQSKLHELQSKVRLFGTAYSRMEMATLLEKHQYLGAVVKQGLYEGGYVSAPLISRTFDNGLNDKIIDYLEAAVNQTIQGASYSQALSTAKQGVDQILKEHKIQ